MAFARGQIVAFQNSQDGVGVLTFPGAVRAERPNEPLCLLDSMGRQVMPVIFEQQLSLHQKAGAAESTEPQPIEVCETVVGICGISFQTL